MKAICQQRPFLEGIRLKVRIVLFFIPYLVLPLSPILEAAGDPGSILTTVYGYSEIDKFLGPASNVEIFTQHCGGGGGKRSLDAILLGHAIQSESIELLVLKEPNIMILSYGSGSGREGVKRFQIDGLYTHGDVFQPCALRMDRLAEALYCAGTFSQGAKTVCMPSFTAEKILVRQVPGQDGQTGNKSTPEHSSSSSGEAHRQSQYSLLQPSSVHTSQSAAHSSGAGGDPPEERPGERLPSTHLTQVTQVTQVDLDKLRQQAEKERLMRQREWVELFSGSGGGVVVTEQRIRMHGNSSFQRIQVIQPVHEQPAKEE